MFTYICVSTMFINDQIIKSIMGLKVRPGRIYRYIKPVYWHAIGLSIYFRRYLILSCIVFLSGECRSKNDDGFIIIHSHICVHVDTNSHASVYIMCIVIIIYIYIYLHIMIIGNMIIRLYNLHVYKHTLSFTSHV